MTDVYVNGNYGRRCRALKPRRLRRGYSARHRQIYVFDGRCGCYPTRHDRAHTGTIGQSRRSTDCASKVSLRRLVVGNRHKTSKYLRIPHGIGVTAAWHGQHPDGGRTLNSQRSEDRPCGNPRPSGRGGCQTSNDRRYYTDPECRHLQQSDRVRTVALATIDYPQCKACADDYAEQSERATHYQSLVAAAEDS